MPRRSRHGVARRPDDGGSIDSTAPPVLREAALRATATICPRGIVLQALGTATLEAGRRAATRRGISACSDLASARPDGKSRSLDSAGICSPADEVQHCHHVVAGAVPLCQHCDSEPIEAFAESAMLS